MFKGQFIYCASNCSELKRIDRNQSEDNKSSKFRFLCWMNANLFVIAIDIEVLILFGFALN